MSFSITVVGKPDAIKRRLAKHSEELRDQSKEEFDAVKPAIETILDQNVSRNGDNVLELEASGHAYFESGQKVYGNCHVKVRTLGVLAE